MALDIARRGSIQAYIDRFGEDWIETACYRHEYNVEYRKQRNKVQAAKVAFAKEKQAEFDEWTKNR